MYLIIITAIISSIFMVIFIKKFLYVSSKNSKRSLIGRVLFFARTLVLTVFAWLFFSLIFLIIIGCFGETKNVIRTETEILAISDGSNISGNFFLGCGTIKGRSYYFFYKKLPNGGFKQGKVAAENVTIFETDSIAPNIRTYDKKFVDEKWNRWALPTKTDEIGIFVPKGSIKQNYNFDLETN